MRAGRYKKALRLTAAVLIVATGLIVVSALYSQGYRFSFEQLRAVYPGRITITGLTKGDAIHMDGTLLRKNAYNSSVATIPIASGTHEVVIDRPGSYPYAKTVSVPESSAASIRPFFMPAAPTATVIGTGTPAYAEGLRLIAERSATVTSTPRRTAGDSQTGYSVASVTGTAVTVEWHGPESKLPDWFCNERCFQKVVAAEFKYAIDGLEFYPGRDDLLIVSVDGAIYAIEIDRRTVQNFQPIVATDRGPLPFTTIPNSHELILAQGSTLVSLDLP